MNKKQLIVGLTAVSMTTNTLPSSANLLSPNLVHAQSLWYTVDGIENGSIRFNASTGEIIRSQNSITVANIPSTIENSTVLSLDNSAFIDCTDLKTVSLPDSLTYISASVFKNCTSLKSISLPKNIDVINDWLFENCTSLESIYIPKSVLNINESAFKDCTSLKNVYYEGSEEDWNKVDIFTLDGDNQAILDATINFKSSSLGSSSGGSSSGSTTTATTATTTTETTTESTTEATTESTTEDTTESTTESTTEDTTESTTESNSSSSSSSSSGSSSGSSSESSSSSLDNDIELEAEEELELEAEPQAEEELELEAEPELEADKNNLEQQVDYNLILGDFTDVNNHWAFDYIGFVVNKGYFNGTSTNTFSPESTMTRGMVVTVLSRIAGLTSNDLLAFNTGKFKDVDNSLYYANAVEWAFNKNITSGTSDTTFNPDGNVTREQMAVFFLNFANTFNIELPQNEISIDFTDAKNISSWSIDAVNALVQAGILNGKTNGSFDPQGTATRAEVATMIQRFTQFIN